MGSASQNWFFLQILPILLKGSAVVSYKVYQALLLLCEVVPALSQGQVAYMDVIIRDYLEQRMVLFPDVRL